MRRSTKKWIVLASAGLVLLASLKTYKTYGDNDRSNSWDRDGHRIRHVLLLSIDGMHSVDFINCMSGGYCPALKALAHTGINYLNTSTSKPSDSFPGLTALVSGGSPRTFGAFYDVAYDRSLDGPVLTTGNGVAGAPGLCSPNTPPTGYTTEFDEGIDINKLALNGGAPPGVDGGVSSIDVNKLDRDPARNCAPVYPWNFTRTNTIFGVIHAAGGYTAWSDKHPSYSSVNGPGDGTNVDDYYSPEINSIPVSLPTVAGCSPLPDQTAVAASNAWTDSFANIQCYDQLKVNAILNEIGGKTHNGMSRAPRPVIFGMNFQSVSVGEKLIEKSLPTTVTGGYTDSTGMPTQALQNEIQYVDAAVGSMITALMQNGIYEDTLVIVTAKHGQSPVDSARYLGISNFPGDPITTSPATILDGAGCIPETESPSNPNGIGPTEDDISMIWLNSSCTTSNAVKLLRTTSPASNNVAGIGEIFSGPILETYFNAPGLAPNGDPRTPDILVTPNIGVTYSGSTSKLAEHGGFSRDDTNVIMLLANPRFHASTVTTAVQTAQVAPTILEALGLDPNALQGVRLEGTQLLPAVQFGDDDGR